MLTYLRNSIGFNLKLIGRTPAIVFLSNTSVTKSNLSKLRKISGFSFSKCKEALVKFNNDIEEAHNWLKAESEKYGWYKMGKLAERPLSNGLIGLQMNSISKDCTCAVMVEINCETDFVARNQNFHKFIHTTTSAFMQHFSELQGINSLKLDSEDLNGLLCLDNDSNKIESLKHLLALNVGSLGENMALNRAVAIKSNPCSYLSIYSHLSWQDINKKWKETHFGKYGVILKYSRKSVEENESWNKNAANITRQICQHIVGLNPTKIGNIDEDKPIEDVDNEGVLIHQPFLLDDNIRISDLLEANDIIIEDFFRFNCGEEIV